MTYRVSIKGVLLIDGKAVLLRNERRGWELPGGGLEIGETPEQTLAREFAEELAVTVAPLRLIDSYLFEVIPGRHVFIVTYGCRLRGGFTPAVSDEHTEFGLYAPAELARIELPEGYARSIRSWSAHAEA
jgi:8-oxo-dGTP pyrophosphatase MutT (NUDIX family)